MVDDSKHFHHGKELQCCSLRKYHPSVNAAISLNISLGDEKGVLRNNAFG